MPTEDKNSMRSYGEIEEIKEILSIALEKEDLDEIQDLPQPHGSEYSCEY